MPLSAAARALCSHFRCSLPLLCPPMAGVAGGHLAAEVHKAGGVGFIGGVSDCSCLCTRHECSADARRACAPTGPYAAREPRGRGRKGADFARSEQRRRPAVRPPVWNLLLLRAVLMRPTVRTCSLGIGLILWRLEPPHLSGSAAQTEPDRWLRYVIHTARAASLWLAFSGSGDLQGWVERARRVEKEGERRERLKVVVMVQRAEAAKEALGWDGVDAIVLQGASLLLRLSACARTRERPCSPSPAPLPPVQAPSRAVTARRTHTALPSPLSPPRCQPTSQTRRLRPSSSAQAASPPPPPSRPPSPPASSPASSPARPSASPTKRRSLTRRRSSSSVRAGQSRCAA